MKKMKSNIDIRQVCILILLLIITILAIYLYNCTTIEKLCLGRDPFSVIKNNFTVSYNGKEEILSFPANVDEACYDVVITRYFHKDELSGDYLSFYAYNPSCDIYINNELVIHENFYYDVFNIASPSHWYCFKVPYDDFVLRINMHNSLKISTLFELYSGSKNAIVFNILKTHMLSIIMSLLIFLAGLGLTTASVFIKGNHRGRLRWLGITSIDSAVWIYSLSNTAQLFVDKISIVSFLGYCSYFMLPLLVTGFILTYDSFKKILCVHIFFWLELAATITVLVLQIFNITQWSWCMIVVHIEVICIIISIIFTFLKNRNNSNSEDKNIYYALMIIGTFICIDIARYYFAKPADGIIKYSTYGIVVLLIYLIYSVIQVIAKNSMLETRNAIYRELAFKDTMTQLQNRSAYELKLAGLRDRSDFSGCVLIADLNNLKLINDTLGHQSGDAAIKRTADILKKFFADAADCYRTGGDEFCVISESLSMPDFEERITDFENAVHKEALMLDYPYSVAVGSGSIDTRGVDECIKAVDTAMYKNKRDSKMGRAD